MSTPELFPGMGPNAPGPRPRHARRVVLAGAVILALSGAGAAAVWAAGDGSTPSPSSTASPAPSGSDSGKHDAKGQRAKQLHGENVVKKQDGTIVTIVTQTGTVESASDSSISVKSEDGFTQSYAVNADTKLLRLPAVAADGKVARDADGKRQKGTEIKATDLKAGDTVRVSGTKDGGTVTATRVVAGELPANAKGPGGFPGKGLGRGGGHAKGGVS